MTKQDYMCNHILDAQSHMETSLSHVGVYNSHDGLP